MAKKGSKKAGALPKSKQARAYLRKTSANRVARNKARRQALKKGIVKKGDGKVINHKNPLSKGGSKSGATNVQSKKSSAAEGGRLRSRRRK